MLRKIISVLCVFLGISAAAYAGPAANIEYIHNAVREKWGVELTSPANPRMVANMEYLMAAVDVVNEYLNGYPVQRPEWKKYATHQVADTIATDFAVSELIGLEWPFEITTTEISSGDTFEYMLGAAGEFMIDWGDGTVEKIERDTTELGMYSHTYETAGTYKIKFRGHATGYYQIDIENAWTAIAFPENPYVASINGSLGAIFGTLPDGTNPMYVATFVGCENLTSVPENLFGDISGTPAALMFYGTFDGCTGLTSIPENLFAGISGAPAYGMFSDTFYGCTDLTGPSAKIGGKYLYEIWPDATEEQVDGMYQYCTRLTDYALIPKAWGGPGADGINAYILHRWGTDVTQNVKMQSLPQVQSMEYLMNAIDVANEMLNGESTTNYADGENTTTPADYDTVVHSVDTLVKIQRPFQIKISDLILGTGGHGWPRPTDSKTGQSITVPLKMTIALSAAGKFTVDWGDGTVEDIVRSDTQLQEYTHTYSGDLWNSDRTIKLSGQATAYNSDETVSTIKFTMPYSQYARYVQMEMSGSIGSVFPTLSDGSQPRFIDTFRSNSSNRIYWAVATVPDYLFSGIYGRPVSHMFDGTFSETSASSNIRGILTIPGGMFVTVRGNPAPYVFANTFSNAPIKDIPAGLFSGIYGIPAEGMFDSTFADAAFSYSYNSSSAGPTIPNLFGNISGALATNAFRRMFASGMAKYSGTSAQINGKFLYRIWPNATADQVGGMYYNRLGCGFSDCSIIPSVWK